MLLQLFKNIFLLSRSLAILIFILFLGSLTETMIPIGVSSSIWGMLILFLLLILQVIKLEWVYASSNLLIKYMTLLFVPFAVAIIDQADAVWANINAVVIANFFSMLITIVSVACLTEFLLRKKNHQQDK